MPLSPHDENECVTFLRRSVLLKACTDDQLKNLCKQAEKKKYSKGEYLQKEGEPQKNVFVLSQGEVTREKNVNGERHQIDTYMGGNTVGSLHVMNKDPAYASTKANSEVVAYEIKSEPIVQYFKTNPEFAYNVAHGLALEVRRHTRFQRTPLLEQPAKTTPIFAVSIAAGVESFYRAAMNAILNQQLTGVRKGSLFPNMHIQIPTRIFYINGFKGIRQFLDTKMKEYQVDQKENGKQIRLLAAITPGIVMSPASSLLEASNAGHSNPEPIYRRWTRGLIPRIGREVIFGVGLNQLSDYCEERVPHVVENLALRNAFGSLSAGMICGYMSHVVHNMSTLKLMNPNKSYSEHMREYIKKAETRVPSGVPESLKGPASVATALIFPTGVLIRTTQIVGSFIILNGTISAINRYFTPSPKPKA